VNPLPYFSWEIDISSAETHFNKQQGFKLKALSFESEKNLFPLLMLSSSWIKIVTQRSKKNQHGGFLDQVAGKEAISTFERISSL